MINRILFLIAAIIIMPGISLAQNNVNSAENLTFQNYGSCGDIVLTTVDLSQATASDYVVPDCMQVDTSCDMWYKFVVPENVSELSFHVYNSDIIPLPGSQEPSVPGLAVYDGSGADAPILLECFSAVAEDSLFNAEIRWAALSGLTAGDTLYMRLWDQNNNAQKLFLAVSQRMDFPENYCETPASLDEGICNILSEGTGLTAPEECGWSKTDNPAFYHFTITEESPQPVSIWISNLTSFSLTETTQAELQIAVYAWNGTDCTNIGGSPQSDPPNVSGSYMGCEAGTEDISYSEVLPPGQYILAIDGYSSPEGKVMYVGDAGVATAVENAEFTGTMVYPNPSSGDIFIKTESFSKCSLLSSTGQLLGEYELNQGKLSLQNLKSGLYTILFYKDSSYVIKKIVVK
ncbi:MAG: T9SS type A sorting domain-containing protein [Bacteroidales bacterium]